MTAKYADVAERIRRELNARSLYLLVFDGNRGNGCEGRIAGSMSAHDLRVLVASLRQFADDVERVSAARERSKQGN